MKFLVLFFLIISTVTALPLKSSYTRKQSGLSLSLYDGLLGLFDNMNCTKLDLTLDKILAEFGFPNE